MKLGLYIHVPFCERKCRYCGFLSFAGCGEDKKEEYVKALCNEIKYKLGALRRDGYEVDTVFLGGGTPSTLSAGQVGRIMEAAGQAAAGAEVTIEANPGTVTEEKLRAYRAAGINRLSMGAQSLDDNVLKNIGRIHQAKDVIDNVELARKCGFDNINLDLMFALPGQSLELWLETLNEAIKLNTEHLSFYSLQLEENTPLYEDFQAGMVEMVSDSTDREMYHRAIKILKKAGYNHYEISNAAKPGFESKHNMKYWSMDEYLGVGLGASSFIGITRFVNVQELDAYIKEWGGEPADDDVLQRGTIVSHEEKLHDLTGEFVFTGLRKTEGIDLEEFEARYGTPFFEYFEAQSQFVKLWEAQKLMEFSEDGTHLRLTEKGIDISNSIMAEFV